MPHSITLITTVAVGLGLAFILGVIAVKLRLPALVGYLLAGVILSPNLPGINVDLSIASQLAEIGIMLLMFGVGLHFSLEDLLSVRRIALPGAVCQMALAITLGTCFGLFQGWSIQGSLIFGLSLSVASTVVLLKALENHGSLDSINGRIAVGWLVVEDLAMVVALVLIPSIFGSGPAEVPTDIVNDFAADIAADIVADIAPHSSPIWQTVGLTLARVAVFIGLMLVVGRRLFPWILFQVARTGSRELFMLCVISAGVGIAYGAAELFGVSFALGAFFAGMVLRNSEYSHQAADETLPLREAFAVLFFVSVGMLFDPRILLEHPLGVLATVAIIVIGKSIVGFFLVILFRYPLNTALIVGVGLAQIGEFSFILADMGIQLNLLPPEGQQMMLAGALFSISLNPLLFKLEEPFHQWILKRSSMARMLEQNHDPLSELPMSTDQKYLAKQVVIVGYGGVGRGIAAALKEKHIPFVIADQNRELIETLRAEKIPAVSGDAADPAVLIQAHIARATLLVIAVPDSIDIRRMVETARTLNPSIDISIRTSSEEEATMLREEEAGHVFYWKKELAHNMSEYVIKRYQEIEQGPSNGHEQKIAVLH